MRKVLLTLLVVLSISATWPTAMGQTPAEATATKVVEPNDPNAPRLTPLVPAAADTVAIPTLEELQARKKQVGESQDTADDLKAKLTEAYDKAIAQLKLADELAPRKKLYSQAVKEAPAELDKIKQSLDKPAGPATPELAPDLTLAQAEQALTQATAALEEAKKKASELESEPKRRADRRTKIPEESNAAKQQIEDIKSKLAAPVADDQKSQLNQAGRLLLQLQQRALQTRLEANTEELLFYDATSNLLAAQRDLAARQTTAAEKLVTFWQENVARLQQQAAQAAKKEALTAKEKTKYAHPAIREIAEENAKEAELQAKLVAQVQEVTKYAEAIDTKLAAIKKSFDEVRSQVQTAGRVTDAMGMLLLGIRDKLPNIGESQRKMRGRPSEISMTQLNGMSYDKRWSELSDLTEEMAQIDSTLDPSMAPTEREDVKKEATTYYETRRKALRAISDLYWDYSIKLARLDISERSLVKTVIDFATYIDANILWVRSNHTLSLSDVGQTARAMAWLVSPANGRRAGATLWSDFKGNPFVYVLVVFVIAVVIVFRSMARKRIEIIAEKVRRAQTDNFLFTAQALALTVILAAAWPAVLLLVAWRLETIAPRDFLRALAAGARALASILFVLGLLRCLIMPHGLAQAHFRLREEALTFLRRHLRWLLALAVPVVFLVEVMHTQQTNDQWYGTVGRLIFIVGLLGLALFMLMALRPTAPLVESYLKQRRSGWLERLRYIWYPLCVLLPLAFAVLAGTGYFYGARHLTAKLVYTSLVMVLILLLRATFVRGLLVAQRRLAVLERKKREAASQQKTQQASPAPGPTKTGKTGKTGEGGDIKAKPEQTIFEMSQQTQRLIGTVTTILLLVGLWYIWSDVLPAFEKLGQYELYKVAEDPITLGAVVTAVVVAILTVVVARNVPGLLEILILRRLPLDRGVRFAIITISRYILVIIGVMLAFGKLGIGWSKVQWLLAAMTVGLGFGLQEIFANFISGLIMLFEQPVRVDDIVTVGDVTGKVTMIHIRATTIRKWDQREFIVPNKEFITGQLINWTLSDNTLRREFAVGIAYGSDIRTAERILYEIAAANPLVLKDPAPTVLFKSFGDNSLDFELRVFISGIENNMPVWHDINCAIDDEFRKAGIEIAFPQRDLHLRSVDPDIPLNILKP